MRLKPRPEQTGLSIPVGHEMPSRLALQRPTDRANGAPSHAILKLI
jgi:hypothetical protein